MRSIFRGAGAAAGPGADASAGSADGRREHRCPGLREALGRALGGDTQPRVLDLGSRSGPTAVFLAGIGARVSVDLVDPPRPDADGHPDGSALDIDHGDGAFDLVLAWDVIDFTPPERLGATLAELARVLAPGGAAMLLARDAPNEEPGTPGPVRRYELVAEDLVVSRRTAAVGPRWSHPSRTIERALGELEVRQLYLQRERVREYVVGRPLSKGSTLR